MPEPLSPDEHRKLIGVLSRLGSDFDGERAAAALLASRMVRDRGLAWDDLISRSAVAPIPSQPAGNTWRVEVDLCLQHFGLLSQWERDFLRSLQGRGNVTPGQLDKVREIATDLRKRRAR